MSRYSAKIDTLRRSHIVIKAFAFSLNLAITFASRLAINMAAAPAPAEPPETICGCNHECCRKMSDFVTLQVARILDTRQRVANHHEWIDFIVSENDNVKQELAAQKKENQELKQSLLKAQRQLDDLSASSSGRSRTPAKRPRVML